MAHSLEIPTRTRTPSTFSPHGLLLPTVAVGGPRYGALVAGLYWGMLALLVAVYGCTVVGYVVPVGSDTQEALKSLHVVFGMGIFALFVVRLVIRLVDNEPPMQPPLVDWQARAAKVARWALYIFMIAMPMLGWLTLNASGESLAFYGFELPVLVAPDRELTSTFQDVHAIAGMLGYLLMGLNIVAALYQRHIPSYGVPPPHTLPTPR